MEQLPYSRIELFLLTQVDNDLTDLCRLVDYARLMMEDELKLTSFERDQKVRALVGETVYNLLNDNLIALEWLNENNHGIQPSLSPKEQVDKLLDGWSKLNKDPDLHDVCWFLITDQGTKCLDAINDEIDFNEIDKYNGPRLLAREEDEIYRLESEGPDN